MSDTTARDTTAYDTTARDTTARETTARDAASVLERCTELARHTALPDGLIERVYLSPEHAAVNRIAGRWMLEAGLATRQDAAGNQVGRVEGRVPGGPALLLGSHLDTVPSAGRYDGILGVLVAITVAGRLTARARATGRPLPFALEVVAFGDEEGTRFGTTLLGSRALAGTWDPQWWTLTDAAGVRLDDAFHAFGLDPERIGDAARARQELLGYLEVHIEQGPVLDQADLPLGVVTDIAGARRFQISVAGAAGHAGTPWPRRRDALAGASEAILAIERITQDYRRPAAGAAGETAAAGALIATVGRIAVFPNAVNVIAARAEFSLDLRGAFDADRDGAWLQIKAELVALAERRKLRVRWDQTHSAPAAHCSARLRAVVAAGIRAGQTDAVGAFRTDGPDRADSPDGPHELASPASPPELFSMAGHDAMALAAVTEIGMLFVRCAGGVSHHPDESVSPADVGRSIDALEAAVLLLIADADADADADAQADATTGTLGSETRP
ncbi:MAG: M20 family metallo-hydrolase [Cryobacterium sp.]